MDTQRAWTPYSTKLLDVGRPSGGHLILGALATEPVALNFRIIQAIVLEAGDSSAPYRCCFPCVATGYLPHS